MLELYKCLSWRCEDLSIMMTRATSGGGVGGNRLSPISPFQPLIYQTGNTLNPATLLPVSESPVVHNCVEVLDSVYSSRPDLQDQPWASVDWKLYVDRSSFINPQGERCAGYVVVTLDTVVETRSLPQGTSTQKAELIALIRALELSEGLLWSQAFWCIH
ncbi:uncharacterized protein LOC117078901 [Trachypithecus francoisi]|uniref:uncharacterized protein LOC117078901 n=1 Tax=Trachypithecus francoisi TaxID=54180 RepID=UPI00141A99F5|nr:uncharacterized protein LOC117078901 [Trachypithecus francoisi]